MLGGLFYPRAVAIIGASNNPYSIGHIVLKNLTDYGYKGPIFPINPKAQHIRSFRCYKSVLDVPDEIDLVNISIKAELLPHVIKECGEKGVKFAIVHSAGFKEVGEEGIKREREMVELAHTYGMRIFGPNSQGIQNADPEVSVYANFTFVPMKPGNVSIVAQGGGMGEMLKLHLHNVGLGHRMYASYGNESDLTMPEILDYYGQDEGTRVIMMQTESFKDPAAFLEVASRITPKKPVLAIKAGRTREGSVAVSSHTGTLVDQAAMATAMYRKTGVVEFHDTHQMIKAAIAMSTQDPPKGNRIGMITNTGGPGIQAVDEAVESGLVLATWSEAGKKRLEESLYAEASLGNPVDVVATAGPDHYFAAMDTLLKEDGVDMLFVFFVTAPFVDLDAIAARIKEACESSAKPVVVVIETREIWYGLIDNLRKAGVPVYEFSEDGVRALAAMTRYAEYRDRKKEPPPELEVDRAAAEAIVKRYEGKDIYIPQVEAFELLSAYGVPIPKVVELNGDLKAAAKKVGFPCVLKVDSPEVIHKTDEGGVVLNIKDEKELAAAYDKMQSVFSGKKASYVLMEQKPAGEEIIIGATAAPGLGSLVMFGLGGIFVEVMKDVIVALAPLSKPEAREMIEGIKGYPVLEGIRGKEGADLDAIEDMLIRVSRLAADFPNITEMDLNPIFAYPKGTAPAAVDVRLKVK
ncbi:MAG: CoA-binding protein [Candidatus Latescibacteria bacterium]|nr:CoA-binding protein [Candidatus Latescibacterota bacterium]NIO28395.1 CoA-binding protein [Candidatus Latescibacterota bacterium]NIO55944.1 CoA-binding protein [Candidatus Latescibacterota bacterium]NIT01908.1 CoA-binding protein [Candidatus Latescibacterota bacterium]